jgi:hypothetical protein
MVYTPDGHMHEMPLQGTVEDLKWRMSEELGLRVCKLVFVAGGRTLRDGKTVALSAEP